MKKILLIILGCLAALSCLGIIAVSASMLWPSQSRYEIVVWKGDEKNMPVVLKIDRLTGEGWRLGASSGYQESIAWRRASDKPPIDGDEAIATVKAPSASEFLKKSVQ